MVIRGATHSDIIALCGQSFSDSLRAIVVEIDGEPLGVVGVLHSDPMQCFSNLSPKLRKFPKAIVKTALELRKILDRYRCDVYAVADVDENNAPRFLEFIGFEHEATTKQGELYKWPQQPPTY